MRRTKELRFSPEVKRRIYERDGGLCILCGRPGDPVAHYIARSQGGLGVEENGLTLCPSCHRDYDNTPRREELRERLRAYLQSKYPEWDENQLYYGGKR